MKIDEELKTQLSEYLQLIENKVHLTLSVGTCETSNDIKELTELLTSLNTKITYSYETLTRMPSFTVGDRINFAGVPLGHEFTSLVLALLQVSGRKPKISDELIKQIKNIDKKLNFTTYISLSCHNCPDVIQALNTMSVLNPNITSTMVDGSAFKEEVESKNIMAVPYVELNGEYFSSGRSTIEEIVAKISGKQEMQITQDYDVLIVGGGPAGAAAAVYAARKGIKTAIVAERFGGQVMDTMGIENLIGTTYTEGPKLVSNLEEHVKSYNVDIFNLQSATQLSKSDLLEVTLKSGNKIKSKTVIISTGARWRNLNIPGESEFKNRGVAYCPHCDGPLFKGKRVAVVGGGNSGVEAAIDLAGIVSHVTLIEYGTELKADKVLQDRLRSLPNANIITNAQTKEIKGDSKVSGISYIDRGSNIEKHLEIEGVFVQIGLTPNTDWTKDILNQSKFGEILVDKYGNTNVPGVFAAGDCTDNPYKQIIISMGSGATAALSAFDYLIRN